MTDRDFLEKDLEKRLTERRYLGSVRYFLVLVSLLFAPVLFLIDEIEERGS